jgi:predicted nuclease of predicted toxin-antitoxin system
MRLYLDDDSVSGRLVSFLQQAGHDVMIPADVNLSGQDDVVHLTRAVEEHRVMLSKNYRDFENLHNLVIRVGGQHAGILLVRQDNDRSRDMTDRATVLAIANLLASNAPIENQFVILNQWR